MTRNSSILYRIVTRTLLGGAFGAAIGLEAARRDALQHGGGMANGLRTEYVATLALGGGVVGLLLLWLKPLSQRGQWSFVLAWIIACIAATTVMMLPELLKQWSWLDLAFADGLGAATGLTLGMYVHEILRRGGSRSR